MTYNFDEIVNREHTRSVKFNRRSPGIPNNVTPLWVADMDFRTLPEVREALIKTAEHGIYGYSTPDPSYYEALSRWYSTRHNYHIPEGSVVSTPGVVNAISTALRSFTKEGDAVLIQTPVYYPFGMGIQSNDRKLVTNPLIEKNGRYEIDFEDFEQKIKDNQVKLFILCNPHNPVGRVFTKDELTRLGNICLANNVRVVADEIHADFIYPGHTHTVFSSISPAFEQNTILCTAPSKTFNLAGLQISNIIITDAALRQTFKDTHMAAGLHECSVMGYAACEAAYTYGAEWVDALTDYLRGNIDFVLNFVKDKLQMLKAYNPEGTYLMWINFSALALEDQALSRFMLEEAGLWLDDGYIFGEGGSGFERFNIASPRSVIREAFEKLEKAVNKHLN